MKKKIKKLIKKKKINFIDIYLYKKILKIKNYNHLIAFLYLCISHKKGNICFSLKNLKNKKIISKNLNTSQKFKNFIKSLIQENYISKNKYTPLILKNNCLYFHKFYYAEKKIIKFFKNKINYKKTNYKKINYKKIRKILKILFKNNKNIYQKIAVSLCIFKKITFILGGPGTGKTNIVAKIIIIIHKIYLIKKIVLCAPTGKASTKLFLSTKNNLKLLNLINFKNKKISLKSYTLHKLLKINPFNFYNNINTYKKKKIKIDLLFIDESSMIDLTIMKNLIESISKNCKIIFLGDYNQLPAINFGTILKDICTKSNNTFTSNTKKILEKIINKKIKNKKKSKNLINNNIIFLKKNYRFKKNYNIIKFSKIIKKYKKNNNKKIKKFFNNKFKNIKFFNYKKNNFYSKMIEKLSKKYKKYWKLIKKKSHPIKIIKEFNKIKILCVLKKSMFGTKIINKNLEWYMIKKKYFKINKKNTYKMKKNFWYEGKPIIITKNNKFLKLNNGDIGITLMDKKDKKKLKVFFMNELTKKLKKISIHLIFHFKTSWSITIHKSQGLEFNSIKIILPEKNYKILTKEVLYTAVTRSKKSIEIFSFKKIFIKSICKKIFRNSQIKKKFLK
ncbi:exodeoxyribonuclease V subunit alpha [Buchnera aphidicola]|uniref:exodeoxyribonuclease V subunit alpha n=1 Tax=Buchnera aphidicola TaxID=9 RepID=UPI0030EF4E43